MFSPKRHFDFMGLCLLFASVIWATVATPLTAGAQDTVEPPGNTIWSTALVNPNPNNFDTPNILNALKNPHSDLVMLSAHRGLHSLAGVSNFARVPENSLRSIGFAAQAGWEMIELDVKFTSDTVPVPILSHDRTWGREWCGLSPLYLGPQVNYNPFTLPGQSSRNDATNPLLANTTLANTRSNLGTTVLRDSVSLVTSSDGHNGCGSANQSLGEFPPTLSDALDYIAQNHIRMVVLLDIQDKAVAQAAFNVALGKVDDAGRPFLNSLVFKMPATLFPNGTSDFLSIFGGDFTRINFIPVINTADVGPPDATITDTEDGGFDLSDFGNPGLGSEAAILAWLQHFESDTFTLPDGTSNQINVDAVEVGYKEPGGILSTVLPNAKFNLHTGAPMTVGEFNPVGEYYPNGDTTQTPQFFRSSNGTCCDTLNAYLYNNPNGTGPTISDQPVDNSDQRVNLNFLMNQGFQYLITDDPRTASNLLRQNNKRNICYMQPNPGSGCTTGGLAPACQPGDSTCQPQGPALNGSAPPGTNFNLSDWELQLPVGTPGNPTTIPNSQLEAGFSDAYFFTNSDGSLEMDDPGTNCVTTPNSTNCRTELQEVSTNGTGLSWLANGTNLLDAVLMVTNPGEGVVIGQVHLASSVSTKPLVELYYDSSGNITAGVEQTTAGGDEIITPLGNVPVGTSFSYEISYSNNQLSISINGGAPVALSIYSLGGLPVYFKAGNYGQSTSPSTLQFYYLNITHTNNSSASTTPPINTGGWYNVVNVNSHLCADVLDWSTNLGTSLDQYTCGNGQANQQWQFTPVGNGIYQVSSRYVSMSWNVTGGAAATAIGIPIQMWSYGGATNEQWQAAPLGTDGSGNGIYQFTALNSGLCLDVPSASTASGQQLDEYTCNRTNAQAFDLVPVTPAAANPLAPTSSTSTQPSVAPGPDPNRWYEAMNVNSGLCLDVYQQEIALGTPLDQSQCVSAKANQQWQFTPVGNGIYQVISRFVNMSWNVTGGNGATGNSVPIQLWTYGSASNEQWQAVLLSINSSDNGVYKFIAQNSGKCLDVPGASTSNGQQLDQYTCNGTNAQSFVLTSVTPANVTPIVPSSPVPIASAWYTLANVNSGLCVDDFNWGTYDSSLVDQQPCVNDQSNQQWQFTPTDSGYYKVQNRFVNAAWDVTGGPGATGAGTKIQLWSYGGGSNQQWIPIWLHDNTYRFVARNSWLCLDVPGASMSNGQQLDQYACNGTNAQSFVLTSVTPANVTPIAPLLPVPSSSNWFNITNAESGLCLDDMNWGTADGNFVEQWACGNGQANQQWQFTPTDSGYYKVQNRFVNAAWDVTGGPGATGAGTKIQLWSYGGGSNEQWLPVWLGGNYFKFVARNSGLCLDVPAASHINGIQLQQYTCNGTATQSFLLTSVNPAGSGPVTAIPATTNAAAAAAQAAQTAAVQAAAAALTQDVQAAQEAQFQALKDALLADVEQLEADLASQQAAAAAQTSAQAATAATTQSQGPPPATVTPSPVLPWYYTGGSGGICTGCTVGDGSQRPPS